MSVNYGVRHFMFKYILCLNVQNYLLNNSQPKGSASLSLDSANNNSL